MADMNDVRRAIWEAYWREERTEHSIMGKPEEGSCELIYPNYWGCDRAGGWRWASGIIF